MANRNAPGCWQIIVAFLLVIFGSFGGCTVGLIMGLGAGESASGSAASYAGLLWPLATLVGAVIGGILAAWVMRRPDL
jgi:hypothetical protein